MHDRRGGNRTLNIVVADNQDITYAGILHICELLGERETLRIEDKATLMEKLSGMESAVVVLDYTLFDINDIAELTILAQRFKNVSWVLFSEDLSTDFLRQIVAISPRFSIVMKESPLYEIKAAMKAAAHGSRFICQHTAERLLSPAETTEKITLTPTETEILKDIALGMTTKEIAEKRISSFHTVNTHRKNIFRKLGVNNVHEAIRYALRAGLVDSAEYYI